MNSYIKSCIEEYWCKFPLHRRAGSKKGSFVDYDFQPRQRSLRKTQDDKKVEGKQRLGESASTRSD